MQRKPIATLLNSIPLEAPPELQEWAPQQNQSVSGDASAGQAQPSEGVLVKSPRWQAGPERQIVVDPAQPEAKKVKVSLNKVIRSLISVRRIPP
jgi:hypothetical protein